MCADDYWILKLDKNRNIQWQKTIGGSGYDALTEVRPTPDGGYILGGYSNSDISGEKTENSKGGYDYWVVKLNSTGSIQWQKTIGGNRDEDLTELQLTRDGGYILIGVSQSGKSGDKSDNNRGGGDYWAVKLSKSALWNGIRPMEACSSTLV